jgi:hypothetical protein
VKKSVTSSEIIDMLTTYHIRIKKDYAASVIEDLQKMDAVEFIEDVEAPIPQWQIEEIRRRKEYYRQHPDELINWNVAQQMIKNV